MMLNTNESAKRNDFAFERMGWRLFNQKLYKNENEIYLTITMPLRGVINIFKLNASKEHYEN